MALIGNRSVLLKSPGRFLSGTVASIERNNFSTAGQIASRFQAMSPVFGGIPSGHLAPSSWALPRTAGGMSAINSAAAAFAAAALAVGGITTTGESLVTFTVADAAGELISSGSGSASFAITAGGNLLASLGAVGSASFAITTNTPLLGAEASAVGSAAMTFSGTLTPYAIGIMSGTTVDSSTLTGDTIASAVWGASAAAFNGAGTTGAKLNTAGSGGVDTVALAAAVWAYTVRGLTATVDADVRYVNGVEITGTGVDGDTWGPA